MFGNIDVIGRGRAGSAIAARLEERGLLAADSRSAELVILCVPDAAIAEVARSVPRGPWLAHVSGATPLAALDPHPSRFSVHPLQTLMRSRAAPSSSTARGAPSPRPARTGSRARSWLAGTLGLRAVRARRRARVAVSRRRDLRVELPRHAVSRRGRAPSRPPARRRRRSCRSCGARSTIDFELTGPISRGDLHVIDAHLDALRNTRRISLPLYRVLVEATKR